LVERRSESTAALSGASTSSSSPQQRRTGASTRIRSSAMSSSVPASTVRSVSLTWEPGWGVSSRNWPRSSDSETPAALGTLGQADLPRSAFGDNAGSGANDPLALGFALRLRRGGRILCGPRIWWAHVRHSGIGLLFELKCRRGWRRSRAGLSVSLASRAGWHAVGAASVSLSAQFARATGRGGMASAISGRGRRSPSHVERSGESCAGEVTFCFSSRIERAKRAVARRSLRRSPAPRAARRRRQAAAANAAPVASASRKHIGRARARGRSPRPSVVSSSTHSTAPTAVSSACTGHAAGRRRSAFATATVMPRR